MNPDAFRWVGACVQIHTKSTQDYSLLLGDWMALADNDSAAGSEQSFKSLIEFNTSITTDKLIITKVLTIVSEKADEKIFTNVFWWIPKLYKI